MQPALAVFPHPASTVTDSLSLTLKMLLPAGLNVPAAWLALPLDVSHPAALSHREAPAQFAVGSGMDRSQRTAPGCTPVLHLLPLPSFLLWGSTCVLCHLTCKCYQLFFFFCFPVALARTQTSFSNCELFKLSKSNVNRPFVEACKSSN